MRNSSYTSGDLKKLRGPKLFDFDGMAMWMADR
jgi:hypothetical protein